MVARQLLSPLLQCAIANHNLYTDNATMRQGLPRMAHVTLDNEPGGNDVAPVLPVAQALPASTGKLLPLALAAATMIGTGGLGAGVAAWMMSSGKAAARNEPSSVVIESEASLLSDLQERGFHLPRTGE